MNRYSFHLENVCLLKECQVSLKCERFTDLMCVSRFFKLRIESLTDEFSPFLRILLFHHWIMTPNNVKFFTNFLKPCEFLLRLFKDQELCHMIIVF